MTYEEVVRICTDSDLFARVVSQMRYSETDADGIRSAYMATYRKEVNRTCGNCIGDALAELVNFYRKNSDQMKKQIECRYRLRAGMLIRLGFGDNRYYSNANLTDEVAEAYILANPEKRLEDFQAVPDDIYGKINGAGEDNAAQAEKTETPADGKESGVDNPEPVHDAAPAEATTAKVYRYKKRQ